MLVVRRSDHALLLSFYVEGKDVLQRSPVSVFIGAYEPGDIEKLMARVRTFGRGVKYEFLIDQ